MPVLPVDGGAIRFEEAGRGEPLLFVHGSWDEHVVWRGVAALLADSLRVVTYSRRGHGESDGGGPLDADVEDLAALIEHAGAPAHVAANSLGGLIALRLATRRPELLRSLALHEPPLLALLGEDHPVMGEMAKRIGGVLELLSAGRREEGAQRFVDDVALGPGAWDALPPEAREMMVRNAHTFVEENEDPTTFSIDPGALERVPVPVLLSGGAESPPFFAEVLDRLERLLPETRRETLPGAGHIPHETHPKPYAGMLREFAAGAAA